MTATCSCGEFPAARTEIPPRVLVVDDEPLVRWSVTTGLRLAGFDACAAAGADEALTLARQPPRPDLVLLDAGLWDADPRQLLDQIRTMSPQCRFLILAVEGQSVALPPWDGLTVVRKPFDLHEVVRTVRAALTCAVHGNRLTVAAIRTDPARCDGDSSCEHCSRAEPPLESPCVT
jgi:DNA-binding response OmpR family regulator